ncbi:UNVERIFIED_ORG: uncharacterized protein DUF1176 [Martelella mediterranea]
MNARLPEVALRCLHALPLAFAVFASAAAGNAAEKNAAEKAADDARALVMALHPDYCDADLSTRFDGLDVIAYPVVWSEADYQGTPVPHSGTLYQVNCYVGAYNLVVAFVMNTDDSDGDGLQPVSFAVPDFSLDYAEGDETRTQLAQPPVVNGFATEALLINPDFDPDTSTISIFEKWRGLGDAYSAGKWTLENGRFVLKHYVIDPIYEANLDNPPEELSEQNFVLYDTGQGTAHRP